MVHEGVGTSVPVHNFIRQLPIAFLRSQRLPLFPIKRVLCSCLGRAESSLQSLDGTLLATYNSLVVCFKQDAHAVYHRIRAVKMMCVGRRIEDVALQPGYIGGPVWGLGRRGN